jgi:hypothetical protein
VPNWKIASELAGSDEKEIVREIQPTRALKKQYKDQGIVAQAIKLRFVCVELDTGEKEVLITSLLDDGTFPYELFQGLYHLRWGVEESYKKDKHRLLLENFSGKTVIAILQDFHACMLMGNLTSILSAQLEDEIEGKAKKDRKYKYQVNTTSALAKIKEMLPKLFSVNDLARLLRKLMDMLVSNLTPIRPNRHFKRIETKRKKRYFMCYQKL